MKKTTIFTLLFSLWASFAYAQAEESLQDLFYCNQAYQLEDLRVISNEYAIGLLDSRTLVSINQEGLFTDTLKLEGLYAGFSDLKIIAKNQIVVHGGRKRNWLKLENGKFVYLKEQEQAMEVNLGFQFQRNEHEKKKGYQFYDLTQIDGIATGYYDIAVRSKMKLKTSYDEPAKKQTVYSQTFEKQPLFSVIMDRKEFTVNEEEEEVSKAIFRKNAHTYQSTALKRYACSYTGKAFVLSNWRANKFYHFDIATKKTTTYNFPKLANKNEVCTFYYDNIANCAYVVKKKSKVAYELYLLEKNYESMHLITTLAHFPEAIIDDNVHYKIKNKENKTTFYCHYLQPLYRASKELWMIREAVVEDKE